MVDTALTVEQIDHIWYYFPELLTTNMQTAVVRTTLPTACGELIDNDHTHSILASSEGGACEGLALPD